MRKNQFKQFIRLIKSNQLSLVELDYIITHYTDYKLKKSQLRILVSLIQARYLEHIGIIQRPLSETVKQQLIQKYHLQDIIIQHTNTSPTVNQSLQIGNTFYSFNIQDKLHRLYE